ncbi:MAG: type II toxin-antitoxin system PemK/MazF family toxin [Candidatus Eremiobacterota bacterium]
MDIGDIYTIEMPPSNGHEQAGNRPAIILQNSQLKDKLPTVIIVPLTSQLTAQTFPGTFVIYPDSENGLSMNSVALIFQIRSIDKKRLKRRIGRLNSFHLTRIYNNLKTLINYP